jgi:hypothetical protein
VATHICHGDPADGALEDIQRRSQLGRKVRWTVPPSAEPGDKVVFYMVRPLTAFVAIGDVGSPAKREPPGSDWAGWHMATIANIQMIPFRHRLDVVRAIPGWGWPRAPRRKTTVPAQYEAEFLTLLGSPVPAAAGGVQENVTREQRRLSRSRNRWLRE